MQQGCALASKVEKAWIANTNGSILTCEERIWKSYKTSHGKMGGILSLTLNQDLALLVAFMTEP